MDIKQYVEKYSLTKGKVMRNYLLGREDRLFLIDKADDGKGEMKNNKNRVRRFLYQINYFLAWAYAWTSALTLIISFNEASSYPPEQDPGVILMANLMMWAFTLLLLIKPLT